MLTQRRPLIKEIEQLEKKMAQWNEEKKALDEKLANPDHGVPDYRFYVTDVPLRFRHIGEHFLGRTMPNVQVVKL